MSEFKGVGLTGVGLTRVDWHWKYFYAKVLVSNHLDDSRNHLEMTQLTEIDRSFTCVVNKQIVRPHAS